MGKKNTSNGNPVHHEIGNCGRQYEVTIHRIVNGYRFPSPIPNGIYSVYANYISRKPVKDRSAEELEYLKLMKTLNPIWPKADKVVRMPDLGFGSERRKNEQAAYQDGQRSLGLVSDE